MDYSTLYARSVSELRALAKKQGVKIPSGTTKMHMIQMILDAEAAQSGGASTENKNETKEINVQAEKAEEISEKDTVKTLADTDNSAAEANAAAVNTTEKKTERPKKASSRTKTSNEKTAENKDSVGKERPAEDDAAAKKAAAVKDESNTGKTPEHADASENASKDETKSDTESGTVTKAPAKVPARKNKTIAAAAHETDTPANAETSEKTAVQDKPAGRTAGAKKDRRDRSKTVNTAKAAAVETSADNVAEAIKSDAPADTVSESKSAAADAAAAEKVKTAPEISRRYEKGEPAAEGENASGMNEPVRSGSAAKSGEHTDADIAEAARNAMKAYNARQVNATASRIGERRISSPDRRGESTATVRAADARPAMNRTEGTAMRGNTADTRLPNANRTIDVRSENAQQRTGNSETRMPSMPPRRPSVGENVTSSYLMQARQASNTVTPGTKQEQPRYQRREFVPQNPAEVTQAVSDMLTSGEVLEGGGVLELMPDGYGFLRAHNCQPGPNDAYLSAAQIRRFNLRQGDYVTGRTRPQREGDRYMAMLFIDTVNGESADKAIGRPKFEDLVPVFPTDRLIMERSDEENDLSLRIIDLLAPIGKGQRALIVSQPKAGKTVLLKKIANAITTNSPEIELIVLLIDERPEEVTDMQRSIQGEVVYSTFDEIPENHAHVSEMVLERAKRLVEQGKDVVILLDSITRLARAYNLVIPPTGRTLSGGIDPGSLHKPKRFFGAARNIEKGGSLTIIATALVETGSRADDIIYEEFKGTGNSEIHLDRKLSERRIFPAIDMKGSGTRREEMLLTPEEMECALSIRRLLTNASDDAEQLLALMEKTPNNEEFCRRMKVWMASLGKNGYNF